jgi:hypothetical protein
MGKLTMRSFGIRWYPSSFRFFFILIFSETSGNFSPTFFVDDEKFKKVANAGFCNMIFLKVTYPIVTLKKKKNRQQIDYKQQQQIFD